MRNAALCLPDLANNLTFSNIIVHDTTESRTRMIRMIIASAPVLKTSSAKLPDVCMKIGDPSNPINILLLQCHSAPYHCTYPGSS